MKKKILVIFIFLLAFFLRFYQLGQNPPSLDWDEASLGYNAYSLLKTGKDEYGNFFPLSIRSFNDYKPPLYTYLTIFPVAIFGLNEFSTRFISALFGALSVIVGYFLIKELFPQRKSIFHFLFFIFFSISPWHIQFSRVAFEANLALFFFILGTFLFVKGLKVKTKVILNSSTPGECMRTLPVCLYRIGIFHSNIYNWCFLLSFISFGFSCYAYHSPRLIIPVFLFGLIFIYRREIIKKIVPFLAGVFILGLMLFPLVRQFASSTRMRLSSVTVLNPDERLGSSIKAIEFDQERGDLLGKLMHNRRIVYAREILGGYLDHFNFDFLFLTGDPPGRHHAAGMGMLYFWDLPFVILGIIYLLRKCEIGKCNKDIAVVFWWFLVASIASSLTTGTPHAVRALFYLPTYQVFIAFGVSHVILNLPACAGRFQNPFRVNLQGEPMGFRIKSGMTKGIIIFPFFLLNFFYYLHMYYIHTPVEYADWWQYGYREAVEEVSKLEDYYDKVIVTYHYDQPYIYFLFYKQTDPSWYQKNWGEGEIKRAERKFSKYEFRNIEWDKDSQLTNVLLVGTPGEIPDTASGVIKQIKFPDGIVAFRIVAK